MFFIVFYKFSSIASKNEDISHMTNSILELCFFFSFFFDKEHKVLPQDYELPGKLACKNPTTEHYHV